MELKQKILSLRNSIDLLDAELEQATKQYLLDCEKDGITQEVYADHTFNIQANPPALNIDKDNVPDTLKKMAIDQGAVRKYLLSNGRQPWGDLNHEKAYKLVIKAVALKA